MLQLFASRQYKLKKRGKHFRLTPPLKEGGWVGGCHFASFLTRQLSYTGEQHAVKVSDAASENSCSSSPQLDDTVASSTSTHRAPATGRVTDIAAPSVSLISHQKHGAPTRNKKSCGRWGPGGGVGKATRNTATPPSSLLTAGIYLVVHALEHLRERAGALGHHAFRLPHSMQQRQVQPNQPRAGIN